MSKKIVIAVLLFALSLGIIPSLTHRVYPISDKTSTIENNITSPVFNGDKQSAHNGTVMELNNTAYQGLIPKLDNPGNVSSNSSDYRNKYEGYCRPVLEYFSQSFMKTYQNIYASLFLISCVFVTVLYALIFKSITLRRYKKSKRAYKGMDRRTSTAITNTCTTRLTTTEPPDTDQNRRAPTNNNYVTESKRSVRNKLRLANIKTAGILFVVTIVFILAFLPAWLISIRVIKPDIIVYYLYFSHNIANPIIYAFFNVTFRKDIRNAVYCK